MLYPRTDAEAGYPDPPVCPICHQRCDTIYRAEDGTIVGCDHCLEATDAWEVNECFPEKECFYERIGEIGRASCRERVLRLV